MDREKLKELRKSKGMTLEDLASAAGTSRQNIHRYEKGVIVNVPPERILAMAKALSVSPDVLMGWRSDDGVHFTAEEVLSRREADLPPIKNKEDFVALQKRNIPILGEIACGQPIVATEEHESYIGADDGMQVDYCLRAHGNSMTGARIYDGDLVFIRKQDTVENGEIAAVIINDEATLKRVYYYPNEQKLVLSPENPHYAPLVYVNEELSDVRIIGKAIAFQSAIL